MFNNLINKKKDKNNSSQINKKNIIISVLYLFPACMKIVYKT